MSNERLIWVAYRRPNEHGNGGPVAVFAFKPSKEDTDEVARRLAEKEGTAPALCLSAVPLYEAHLAPPEET